MIQVHASVQGSYDDPSYFLLCQILRTATRSVQIAVHPYECRARRQFAGRRVWGVWEAAMKMPGDEEPWVFRILVGRRWKSCMQGSGLRPSGFSKQRKRRDESRRC